MDDQFDSDRNDRHDCPGETCPFIVEMEDGLVCSKTGICMTSLHTGFSFENVGTILHAKKKDGSNPKIDIVNLSFNDSQNDILRNIIKKPSKDESLERAKKKEWLFSECKNIITEILYGNRRMKVALCKSERAIKEAVKFFKKECKQRNERQFSLSRNIARACVTYKFNGGMFFEEPAKELGEQNDDLIEALTRRCLHCCDICEKHVENIFINKQKLAYICLVTLDMMKVGVHLNGTTVVRKEAKLAFLMPALSDLKSLGYEKSKYTDTLKLVQGIIGKLLKSGQIETLKI